METMVYIILKQTKTKQNWSYKMTNEQLEELQNIRNAVDDLYTKLEVTLYEKQDAVKVSYKAIKPSDLITDNLRYIVEKLNLLQEAGE